MLDKKFIKQFKYMEIIRIKYSYMKLQLFTKVGWLDFYNISNLVDYLMPIPVYIYI